MNWTSFISTLLAGLITFSAILFTNALDVRKRKRAHQKLIHALLQGLRDEIACFLEGASRTPVCPIEAAPEGKPYEGLFTASQDYFTVYHRNADLVMQIDDADLRRHIILTYNRAKGLLDTVTMNRLYLERYHYLQSTFLKTKDSSVQAESEDYRHALIEIATQLKKADADFKIAARNALETLVQKVEAPAARAIAPRNHGKIRSCLAFVCRAHFLNFLWIRNDYE
jgi:hypothetical protein